MPFNINEFRADISDKGYIKSNYFEVFVAPPPVSRNSSSLVRHMTHRIEQVRIPGINFMSADINRYGVGPTQKQPFNAQFNEIGLTILCDNYGDIWQFWHDWLRAIYQFTPVAVPGNGTVSTQANYNVGYKDQYSSTMSIALYDVGGTALKRIDLYQAFPTSIREMPLSWEDRNNLLKLGVSVTFKEYTLVAASG